MQKVLPGSSREALAFIGQHWKALVQMSLLPMLVYAGCFWLQIRLLANMYRQLGGMMGGQVDPEFWSGYFRLNGLIMLLSVAGAFMMGALFTQIIRYQKLGEFNWLPASGPALKATAITIAYAIGMTLLSMFAYMGVAFAVLIPVSIIVGVSESPVLAALLIPLAIIAIVGFLYWFMFRFFVGLPGVALGSVPDFFKDIWPLAKGESWGLPLRIMLATIVVYVPIVVIGGLLIVQFFSNPENAALLNAIESDDAAAFTFLAQMIEGFAPYILLVMLIFTPLAWFSTLLLGIAFQRFRTRQEGSLSLKS